MEGWRDMVNNNVDSTNELMNLQKLHKDFNASLLKIRTLMKDNFTSDSNHDSVGIQQSLDKFKRVMEKRVLLFDHLQGENDFEETLIIIEKNANNLRTNSKSLNEKIANIEKSADTSRFNIEKKQIISDSARIIEDASSTIKTIYEKCDCLKKTYSDRSDSVHEYQNQKNYVQDTFKRMQDVNNELEENSIQLIVAIEEIINYSQTLYFISKSSQAEMKNRIIGAVPIGIWDRIAVTVGLGIIGSSMFSLANYNGSENYLIILLQGMILLGLMIFFTGMNGLIRTDILRRELYNNLFDAYLSNMSTFGKGGMLYLLKKFRKGYKVSNWGNKDF